MSRQPWDTLFSSSDNGMTWNVAYVPPGRVYGFSISPSGTLILGWFVCGFSCTNGMLISNDDGLSWSETGLLGGDKFGFQNHNIITVNRPFLVDAGTGSIFYISSDDGHTWTDLGTFFYRDEYTDYKPTSVGFVTGNIFFGGTGASENGAVGLFISRDSCKSWTPVYADTCRRTPEDILVLSSDAVIVATDGDGIYSYSPNGDSLGTLNDGLTNLNMHTLAMDSLGYVYAGTDSGVFSFSYNDTLFANEVQYLQAGWNLLSLPIHPYVHSKETNYPAALSSAFEYIGSYQECQELCVCKGYWLKVGSESYFPLWGNKLYRDSVNVSIGWNMIGSLSEPFLASTITGEPPGIVTSLFWEYDGTQYNTSDTIKPGKGYWVKVNQSGKLFLSSSGIASAMNRIKVVPTSEQPPPPPNGEIQNTKFTIPKQFALDQNYPNPFNPLTIINYQLPADNRVTIKIYNVLGQEVKTLIDEIQDAGYKSVTWNASSIPSGVYFYRLQAGNFTETRKLLLLR